MHRTERGAGMAGYYTIDVHERMKQVKGNLKQPFPHQKEAFAALSKALPTPINEYKGTLLVLPTGGGKTFTSINWICRNILSKGIKILWLAQSSYLIDQAAKTFMEEVHNAAGREKINLRVVSGSTSHANAGTISLTDDVLICTTQTAISAYSSESLDGMGEPARTPFRQFIDFCTDKELFVVVDEAHHTPAYGCRTLILSMRDNVKKLYVLGLTATPMHNDKRISGWLKNIYNAWICYKTDDSTLQVNKILAVPRYIERDTGFEFEVDDGLYDRLMNKHKDLPDHIIEYLANNSSRNNFIVSDYLNNRHEYDKTLIFADRSYQCEYIVEKLSANGVRANAVYSVVAGQDPVYRGGSGRRNDETNRRIMQEFREGKYDVIVNVKMLTEGVDVPDVKTVMVTRQTTSNILMTQMIGRALRGEKAGGGKGKDFANIVFFSDSWKRQLPWARILEGELRTERPATQGRNPMQLVSVHLVKLAVGDIEYKGFENADFLTFVPVGFFGCEFTIAITEGSEEELVSFAENLPVYNFNKSNYAGLLGYLKTEDLTRFASEDVDLNLLSEKAKELELKFFEHEINNFDGQLLGNIEKIIRHMAQNNEEPIFIDFLERDIYDMDRIAGELINMLPLDADIALNNKFNDMSLYWNFLYKNFDNFMDAYYKAQKRVLAKRRGESIVHDVKPEANNFDELTEDIKQKVAARDNFACLCCRKKQRRGVSLQADHIIPVSMGGNNAISNLQTLCKFCNAEKGINTLDFRKNSTPLRAPKEKLSFYSYPKSDSAENVLARIINNFYHCGAVFKINYHERKNGQFYENWEIVLYNGNNPDWLLIHIKSLLEYINNELGFDHVKNIIVKS